MHKGIFNKARRSKKGDEQFVVHHLLSNSILHLKRHTTPIKKRALNKARIKYEHMQRDHKCV